MQTIIHFFVSAFSSIGPFFILLGLLIFVHELGHFLVARLCGVRVETFSLGFGKKILQYKPGDTTYCVSIVPLGGYIKMYGDDPSAQVPLEERQHAFLHKPVLQRIAIVLAGPLMNLVFAVFLFMVIARVGEELPAPIAGDIPENSVAYQAGFRSGDKILKINDHSVQSWLDVQDMIERAANQSLSFVVQHAGSSDAVTVSAQAQAAPNENVLSVHPEVGHIDGLTSESLSAIIGIIKNGPAEKAGLSSLDLITAVNDQPVSSFLDLQSKIKNLLATSPGQLQLKFRNVEADDKPENTHVATIPLAGVKLDGNPLLALGIESAELYILKVKPGSPAAKAGLQAKDHITQLDGQDVQSWNQVLNRVKGFTEGGSPIAFVVARRDETLKMDIRPELTELMTPKGQEEKRYTVGIVSGSIKVGPDPVLVQIKGPIELVQHGIQQSIDWTGLMVMSLVRLAEGQVSAKNIGGVITIGRVASRSFEVGVAAFLKTMAIISLNLFLLNLLPVPVLDGGHLLFFSIEALRGTPISLKKLEIAQQVGLTLLIMLMAFAFFNDLSNLFSARW